MTTTAMFQTEPDYYISSEECEKSQYKKSNSNARYKFFNQTHFTAGDIQQFNSYRDPVNGRLYMPKVDIIKENRFFDSPLSSSYLWEKYKDIEAGSVMNTFSYIFNKFKKGIFLKIKNGELRVFLPFSKNNFINEWSDRIRVHPKYGDLMSYLKMVQESSGYKFKESSVNKFISGWYSNNCLVRYEYPIKEGDTNVDIASDMFKVLCKERKLPDMEFFVNRRDFPIIKSDNTEPYFHLFDSEKQPLLSHSYGKYCPILSMVTSEGYADIPMPTGDDWARVSREEGKYFQKTCKRTYEMKGVPWKEKKPIAIFRGASTGCGVSVHNNPRLKLAYLSYKGELDKDGLPFLNAGITQWNNRPRKLMGNKYLQTIDIEKIPFPLVSIMTPNEQANYKYIINVDGHVSAFRLSLELGSGCCLILVASRYKMWFRHLLKPWVHYIPVKSDLSDLVEKIKWCKIHDTKCEQIATNSLEFFNKYLTKDGILDYLQLLLYRIKEYSGMYFYNEESIASLLLKKESIRCSPNTDRIINKFPPYERTYAYLRGIETVFKKSDFMQDSSYIETLFTNNNTVIKRYSLKNFTFLCKSNKNTNLTHEMFIGRKGVNKLAKYIPNFSYTFGLYDNCLLVEDVKGQTFLEYLKSPFDIQEYLLILVQICLALEVAQQKLLFVHNDLAPWNIIIKKLKVPEVYEYPIGNTFIRIKTHIVPIIIDFGISRLEYNGNIYGTINIFRFSTIQDVLSLLITSLYESLSKRLSHEDVETIFNISNFLSGTGYRQEKFTNIKDLREFLYKNKKFSDLLYTDKSNLEEKTPLDLYSHILAMQKYTFMVETVNESEFKLDRGNTQVVPLHVLEENPLESIRKLSKKIRKCVFNYSENVFFLYYKLIILYEKRIDDTCLDTFDDIYSTILKLRPLNIKYEFIELDRSISWREDSFDYSLCTILKELRNFRSATVNTPFEYIEYVKHVLFYSGRYKMSLEHKDFYLKNFKELLDPIVVKYRNNMAVLNTCRELATEICQKNLDVMLPEIDKTDNNYEKAKEYIKICQKYLNK